MVGRRVRRSRRDIGVGRLWKGRDGGVRGCSWAKSRTQTWRGCSWCARLFFEFVQTACSEQRIELFGEVLGTEVEFVVDGTRSTSLSALHRVRCLKTRSLRIGGRGKQRQKICAGKVVVLRQWCRSRGYAPAPLQATLRIREQEFKWSLDERW